MINVPVISSGLTAGYLLLKRLQQMIHSAGYGINGGCRISNKMRLQTGGAEDAWPVAREGSRISVKIDLQDICSEEAQDICTEEALETICSFNNAA
jgi:hypothetical protein